jgi:hypothetical protein
MQQQAAGCPDLSQHVRGFLLLLLLLLHFGNKSY